MFEQFHQEVERLGFEKTPAEIAPQHVRLVVLSILTEYVDCQVNVFDGVLIGHIALRQAQHWIIKAQNNNNSERVECDIRIIILVNDLHDLAAKAVEAAGLMQHGLDLLLVVADRVRHELKKIILQIALKHFLDRELYELFHVAVDREQPIVHGELDEHGERHAVAFLGEQTRLIALSYQVVQQDAAQWRGKVETLRQVVAAQD